MYAPVDRSYKGIRNKSKNIHLSDCDKILIIINETLYKEYSTFKSNKCKIIMLKYANIILSVINPKSADKIIYRNNISKCNLYGKDSAVITSIIIMGVFITCIIYVYIQDE